MFNAQVQELLEAVQQGKTVQRQYDNKWMDQSTEGVLRVCAELQSIGKEYLSSYVRVKPPLVERFIPVHRMPGGGIFMPESKCGRKFAIDDAYNCRNPMDKLVGVLHVQLDPETLELVSASMEKL